jgi:hypothetical protein
MGTSDVAHPQSVSTNTAATKAKINFLQPNLLFIETIINPIANICNFFIF